jgi:acyl-CoA synthetase (NDP forming)
MPTVDSESLLEAAVRRARAEGRTTLLEHEAYGFLPLLGLAAPRHLFVPAAADPAAASEEICAGLDGDRVVLKIVAADVLHKTERGGVVFVARSPASVREAVETLLGRFSGIEVSGVLAAEGVPFDGALGSELLLGIRWTEDFGPIVTFGIGGVLTEALDRALLPGLGAAIFSPGLTREPEIEDILRAKFVTPIVTGTARGQRARMELAALRALIASALSFAETWVPDPIAEIEVNPFVSSSGEPVALDALVKLTTRGATAIPPDRPIEKIERLLRPRTIAIAGVSRSMNPGRVIVKNLLDAGYDRGAITIVKPGDDSIDGCRCVPDLASAGVTADLLVLAISSDQIPDAIDSAIANRSAESIIVIPGGLGEREGSESLEARVRASIAASRVTDWRGPVVNGGNCLGITSRPGKVDTIFLPAWKLRGDEARREAPLAIVSQSGAFAAARITALGALAPRYVISIGNQIDLTSGDYLEYLSGDPEIEVFAVYVEGFRPLDGRRWLTAARSLASSGRPVILYRAGRTPEGSRASASHTAAIAGDAAVARELAVAAGVVVAESLEEFDDLTRLFTLLSRRRPSGRRLAAMSNAGFETVAFADSLSTFELAKLSSPTRLAIEEIVREQRLERVVSIANPLDVNPMMGDGAFARTCAALLDDEGVDAAVVGCVPLTPALATLAPAAGHGEDLGSSGSVVTRLAELWVRSSKPWVAVVDSGPLYDPMAAALERAGIPLFRTADRALRAFSRWTEWRLGPGRMR